MLCCFLASDGIMLMYDLWRGALFYLLSGDMGRLFYLPLRGTGCSSCSHSLSACLLRPWWKHRATLSSLQTSIRGATRQTARAEESYPQGEERVSVKQSLSLTNTSAVVLLVEMFGWQELFPMCLQANTWDNAANTLTLIQVLGQSTPLQKWLRKNMTCPVTTTSQCPECSHKFKDQSLLAGSTLLDFINHQHLFCD